MIRVNVTHVTRIPVIVPTRIPGVCGRVKVYVHVSVTSARLTQLHQTPPTRMRVHIQRQPRTIVASLALLSCLNSVLGAVGEKTDYLALDLSLAGPYFRDPPRLRRPPLFSNDKLRDNRVANVFQLLVGVAKQLPYSGAAQILLRLNALLLGLFRGPLPTETLYGLGGIKLT
jgi:hypothetical protein